MMQQFVDIDFSKCEERILARDDRVDWKLQQYMNINDKHTVTGRFKSSPEPVHIDSSKGIKLT